MKIEIESLQKEKNGMLFDDLRAGDLIVCMNNYDAMSWWTSSHIWRKFAPALLTTSRTKKLKANWHGTNEKDESILIMHKQMLLVTSMPFHDSCLVHVPVLSDDGTLGYILKPEKITYLDDCNFFFIALPSSS